MLRKTLHLRITIYQEIQKIILLWLEHLSIEKPTEKFVSREHKQDFPNPIPPGRPPKGRIEQVKQDTTNA